MGIVASCNILFNAIQYRHAPLLSKWCHPPSFVIISIGQFLAFNQTGLISVYCLNRAWHEQMNKHCAAWKTAHVDLSRYFRGLDLHQCEQFIHSKMFSFIPSIEFSQWLSDSGCFSMSMCLNNMKQFRNIRQLILSYAFQDVAVFTFTHLFTKQLPLLRSLILIDQECSTRFGRQFILPLIQLTEFQMQFKDCNFLPQASQGLEFLSKSGAQWKSLVLQTAVINPLHILPCVQQHSLKKLSVINDDHTHTFVQAIGIM